MEEVVGRVSHISIPLFIDVLERPGKKRVTIRVVKTQSPNPYSQTSFENIRSRYISQGWSVSESARTSSVYILELNPECSSEKKMIRDNVGTNPKGYLYVGMTGLDPEERLANHLSGVKSCGLVRKYFQARFGSMSGMFHYEAEFLENHLPGVLRDMGYWVYQK
jgi:hypothetical protein